MTRIQQLFDRRKSEGKAALIAYLTAGDPSAEATPGFVAALERGGADLIELGVPFSDPIADGPVIQRGSDRALKAGLNVHKVLEIASKIRLQSHIPLLLFTYVNPVLRYGLENLARDAKAAGIDGCLLTDVSVEEADVYVNAMRAAGLDTVFLAAPTSTPERLKLVAKFSSGFIYLVSRTGVTGERAELSKALQPLIDATRAISTLPVAAGFGISTPEQAAAVAKIADGVVVGSAIVRLIEQNAGEAGLEKYARSLRDGMDA
ncbi:MAG TPA: tryptophan synthase subunit alpha [Bryobacteraceae bacterium]|jgi:tryptophan synthase alpha chain|nr:tryptophan synthase subunit alpha [Bryobacteraceae bacterium]